MNYSLISLTEISLKCHTTFGYKKITFNFGKGEGLKRPNIHGRTYSAPHEKGNTYIRRTPPKIS